MPAQQLLPGVPCSACFSQPSPSGRQLSTGPCPVAPPCRAFPQAFLGTARGQATLVARRAPRPVEVAPHLQLGCGSASRRHRRGQRAAHLRCHGSAGVLRPEDSGALAHLPLTIPTTAMAKRGLGSSGGAAVLERSKLDLSQKTPTSSAPKLDDSGGAGNIGKILHNGGGGDDDGGDDDDYFNPSEPGDGDDGNGFFKGTLRELYDQESIKAVLQEWGRTFSDIPLIIRQSAEMGLFSSAQLVRFVSMDVRPSMTRAASRALSPQTARGFVGRLMADPAFAQKLAMEGVFTVGLSMAWEYAQRGDRFLQEFDFAAINTLSLAAATGALVWLMAPNRSHGAAHKFSWQNRLHALPGNVFDRSTPVHRLSLGTRTGSLLWKSAELAFVGALSGLFMSLASSGEVRLRRLQDPDFTPSVDIPSPQRSALGMAASMGLFGNLRYQAVSGIDRVLSDRINFMWVQLLLTSTIRAANQLLGQPTRLYLQGLPSKVPDHKMLQRQRQRQAQLAAAQAQMEQLHRQQAAAAAKPKRRAAPSGSSGFEMSTRQHQRHSQPSMALASAQ